MKKMFLTFIFFVFCCIFVFGNNDTQGETDSLLFMPNSADQFVDREQASIQLDNLARSLSNIKLVPGQIIVYGYAAYAPNDINSDDLSKERALFVINELQKRGVSKYLFAEPVGNGSVYLWGDNVNENDRKLNRRVRIVLRDEPSVNVVRENKNTIIKTSVPDFIYNRRPAVTTVDTPIQPNYKFPWWILVLLSLYLLFLFIILLKRSRKQTYKEGIVKTQLQASETENASEFTPKSTLTTSMVNLDEEIRNRAYELSLQHYGLGDYREQDWNIAVSEISAMYKACGHSVYSDGESWWASRSYSYDFPEAGPN
jgi:hypothetical protein